MIKKIFIRIGIVVLSLLFVFFIAVTLFVNFNPSFGEKPKGKYLDEIIQSSNYEDDSFINSVPTESGIKDWSKMPSVMKEFIFSRPGQRPDYQLPVLPLDSSDIVKFNTGTKITWFGHSAFLIEIGNKNVLIDPMLGDVPAPASFLGNDRFNPELPIATEKLPHIDAVLFSHDHYDHLDYGTILKLKEKTSHFFVPLGVGSHLRKWGIEPSKITELDWWQETTFEELRFALTPARHFSGRSLTDRNKTLWGSWVIQSENSKIFFSGDGGYFKGFKEIGEKYGPFDAALIECGQYNENWSDIHMMPEESVQAAIDVKGRVMIPIHWGSFQLSIHDWNEPVIRASKKATELGIEFSTPKIGESIILGNSFPTEKWWQDTNRN